jgi:hypothetical protein
MTLLFSRRQRATRGDLDARPAMPVAEPAAGISELLPLTHYPIRLYTATHMLTGTVTGRGRLSGLLNGEPTIGLSDVTARAIGEPGGSASVAAWLELDPFEIELVMTLRLPDASWVRARRVHKLRYSAEIAADPFRISGLVHAFAGANPTELARHAGGIFIPITEPVVRRAGRVVSDPRIDAVLINRHLVREITLVDAPGAFDAAGALLARRALVAS